MRCNNFRNTLADFRTETMDGTDNDFGGINDIIASGRDILVVK